MCLIRLPTNLTPRPRPYFFLSLHAMESSSKRRLHHRVHVRPGIPRSGPSKQSPSNPADGTTRHQPPEALMTHPVRLFPSAHGRPLSQERHDFNASGRFTASPSTARKERAKARLWQVGSRTLYTGLKRGQPAISCTRKLPYLK